MTKLLNTTVTPQNVLRVLSAHECPLEFDLLKIDIDSFDGILLEAILTRYRPHLIQMELNPEVPPPIAFSVMYDARYRHGAACGFFGCPLSYVMQVCAPLEYDIVDLDLSSPPTRQDVLLGCRELGASGRRTVEREWFLTQRPIRSAFMEIGIDTRVWRTITDAGALFSEVWDACCRASIARFGRVLPFHMSIYSGIGEPEIIA